MTLITKKPRVERLDARVESEVQPDRDESNTFDEITSVSDTETDALAIGDTTEIEATIVESLVPPAVIGPTVIEPAVVQPRLVEPAAVDVSGPIKAR